MLIYYAVGRHGVRQAREASRSALPDAPVIPDRQSGRTGLRVRAAGALHRLADRIGPAEARAGHGSPQRA